MQTHVVGFPDVVATLLVLDQLVVLRLAAAEGNTTGLTRPYSFAAAVEVNILVPVLKQIVMKVKILHKV